jgi:putative pyruvate formate lyase activating enzyme
MNRQTERSFYQPAYRHLLNSGELERRVALAFEHLEKCDFCGWVCGVNRRIGKLGVCRTGERAKVSSFGPHLGEENPLRGWRGSGTIFFTRCNLRCQFCQNHDISQTDIGTEINPEQLAGIMLDLQESGCHNINFVSPTHVVAPILAAVLIAAREGLRIPLGYNTGGYDSLAALALLDGVIDIYMPDMKFANANIGLRYSKIRDYPKVNRAAVKEMHRQVGDLELDERGLAIGGLLVRHLVLPHGVAGTLDTVHFLAEEVSPNTYLNLMDQYRPEFNARLYPQLSRKITRAEYETAVQQALEAGLHRLDTPSPYHM